MRATANLIRTQQEGKAEAVARQLADMVEVGLLSEGEQLPNETALSAQFGVAPVTLREALSILRERGIIETRRGRHGGSFVCRRTPSTDHELRERLGSLTVGELRDFADEHMAISVAAAQLAASRADATQHLRLSQLIEDLDSADDAMRQRQLDARFHIEIAVAAQSVRLTRSEARLQAELGELLWLPYRETNQLAVMQTEHRAILEAITSRDANLAGALAQAHINKEMRRLTSLKLGMFAALE